MAASEDEPILGVITPVVACGVQESSCGCGLPPGHDGHHVCPCGGAWEYDADDNFVIVAWPGSAL